VKIEYSTNNGSSWSTVIATTPDDGSYPWIVPGNPSANCLVRISDTDGSPIDQSNAVFTIWSDGITVTSPNGGETWQVGSTHNINWTSSGTSGNVKIEYSTNNGSSWSTVIATTPDDGSYPWIVPGNPSANCLVRISDTDGSPIDQSNAMFTISSALIAPHSNSTPTVDGIINPTEWSDANEYGITFSRMDGANTSGGTLYLQHDNMYLYVGIKTNVNAGWDVYMAARIDGNNDDLLLGSSFEPFTDINIEYPAPGGWNGYIRYDYLNGTGGGPVAPPIGTERGSYGTSGVSYEFKIRLSDLNLNSHNTIGFQLFNLTDSNIDHAYIYPSNSNPINPETWDNILVDLCKSNKITEYKYICQGQNYYEWTTSGIYSRILNSISGCDTIITTNLTVIPIYNFTENKLICQGQNYQGWTTTGT